MSKRSHGELQLSLSRPEGCKNPSVHSSGYTFVAQTRMQAQGVAAASVRGHVVPQLRLLSANAEHLDPRARPRPLDHVQYKEPWPEAAFPRHAGVVTFRLRGGLPRGVAVLGDRRPVLSCTCTPV